MTVIGNGWNGNGKGPMELIILAAVIGLIPAAIAQSKGRNFVAWWLYGAALFIVALRHALLMKSDAEAIDQQRLLSGDNRKCPFCAEIIKREAVVCRYCGPRSAAGDTRCEARRQCLPQVRITDARHRRQSLLSGVRRLLEIRHVILAARSSGSERWTIA